MDGCGGGGGVVVVVPLLLLLPPLLRPYLLLLLLLLLGLRLGAGDWGVGVLGCWGLLRAPLSYRRCLHAR